MFENFFNYRTGSESQQQSNNMMSMCREMMKMFFGQETSNRTSDHTSDDHTSDHASKADPELEECFNEWVKTIETAIISYVNETKSVDSMDIALKLNIPVNCSKYIIKKLISEERINL